MTSTLLLLADGRLPTGGHIHSGGVEEAVNDGRICGLDDLGRYLEGRLSTTGWVDAALTVAARDVAQTVAARDVAQAVAARDVDGPLTITAGVPAVWQALDAEAAARVPVPEQRRASRSQGRGLLRAAARLWPEASLGVVAAVHADGPSWPVALGVTSWVAGVERVDASLVAAQASVTGPAWAAVRLLGLDPFSVAAVLARLAPEVDAVATRASTAASCLRDEPAGVGLAALPAAGAPLSDVGAVVHAAREGRLFAS